MVIIVITYYLIVDSTNLMLPNKTNVLNQVVLFCTKYEWRIHGKVTLAVCKLVKNYELDIFIHFYTNGLILNKLRSIIIIYLSTIKLNSCRY